MKAQSEKITVAQAEHYQWGNQCDGWHLLKNESLSVIQERMPPNTSEKLHYHNQAQQLFYVLSGEATFEIEEKVIVVTGQESLHVPSQTRHKISNHGPADLHFLVISAPRAHGDRVEL